MAVKPVYNCFHPVLKEHTAEVEEFDQSVKNIVDDLYDTMYNISNGVGLAANQIGEKRSVIVIDTSVGDENAAPQPITLINPEILFFSDEDDEYEEGCLSVPTFFEKVLRPKAIQIKYLDLDMKEHNREVEGFLARVMQHEVDHLNGKLFFERLTPLRRTLSKNKLRKIRKGELLLDYPMILPDGSYIEGKKT